MTTFSVFLLPETCSLSREERLLYTACLYTGDTADTAARFQTERLPGGKPWFPLVPQLHFSITHSGAYWVCAFGSAPLGIDLQEHRPCQRKKLSQRFFHSKEDALLSTQNYDKGKFFDLWAAKESYLKYRGTGLSGGLDSVCLTPPPQDIFLHHIPFQPGYSFCLCSSVESSVALYPLDL